MKPTAPPPASAWPGALDWQWLQVFAAAAELGSLSAAAERLGTSQPTLTRRLAALEAACGQALFERSSRGLALTPAGRSLLEPVQRMNEQIARAAVALDRHRRTLAGTVRITASHMVSQHLLLPVLARLRISHPEIQLELVPSDATLDLLGREADIAVRMHRPVEPGLIARRLADVPVAMYAHRSYVQRHGPVTVANMAQHQWIGMDRSDLMRRGFAQAGYDMPREFFSVRTDQSVLAWEAVRLGMGVGAGICAVADKTPGMVRMAEFPVPPMPCWVVVHRELRGTPRLRTVFNALAAGLNTG